MRHQHSMPSKRCKFKSTAKIRHCTWLSNSLGVLIHGMTWRFVWQNLTKYLAEFFDASFSCLLLWLRHRSIACMGFCALLCNFVVVAVCVEIDYSWGFHAVNCVGVQKRPCKTCSRCLLGAVFISLNLGAGQCSRVARALVLISVFCSCDALFPMVSS